MAIFPPDDACVYANAAKHPQGKFKLSPAANISAHISSKLGATETGGGWESPDRDNGWSRSGKYTLDL